MTASTFLNYLPCARQLAESAGRDDDGDHLRIAIVSLTRRSFRSTHAHLIRSQRSQPGGPSLTSNEIVLQYREGLDQVRLTNFAQNCRHHDVSDRKILTCNVRATRQLLLQHRKFFSRRSASSGRRCTPVAFSPPPSMIWICSKVGSRAFSAVKHHWVTRERPCRSAGISTPAFSAIYSTIAPLSAITNPSSSITGT